MRIVEFPECNTTYAKDQPEYLSLPAYTSPKGRVVSCWKMSFIEKVKVLFTGKVYLSLLTFNRPLQPQLLTVYKPVMDDYDAV